MKLKCDVSIDGIRKAADTPKLDGLLALFEPATGLLLAERGGEIEKLFYALKEYLPTPEGFDLLFKFDALAGENSLRAFRVGFVCGLLLGSNPLQVLNLRE